MTEPAYESSNSLKNIATRILAVCLILLIGYAVFPPLRIKIDESLMKLGFNMQERRETAKQRAVDKVMNASGADLVRLNLLQESRRWLDFTNVQKKKLREDMEGKVVETSHVVYDVRQTSEVADLGYGEFNVKLATTNFANAGMAVECNFIALTEADEAQISGLSSGETITLRGTLKSIGSLTIELKNCVLIK